MSVVYALITFSVLGLRMEPALSSSQSVPSEAPVVRSQLDPTPSPRPNKAPPPAPKASQLDVVRCDGYAPASRWALMCKIAAGAQRAWSVITHPLRTLWTWLARRTAHHEVSGAGSARQLAGGPFVMG